MQKSVEKNNDFLQSYLFTKECNLTCLLLSWFAYGLKLLLKLFNEENTEIAIFSLGQHSETYFQTYQDSVHLWDLLSSNILITSKLVVALKSNKKRYKTMPFFLPPPLHRHVTFFFRKLEFYVLFLGQFFFHILVSIPPVGLFLQSCNLKWKNHLCLKSGLLHFRHHTANKTKLYWLVNFWS